MAEWTGVVENESDGMGNGEGWWRMRARDGGMERGGGERERGMAEWRGVVENESEGWRNGEGWWRMRARKGGMERGGGE